MADAVQVKFEADIRDLKKGLNEVTAGLRRLQTQSANTSKQVVAQNTAMTNSFNSLKSSIVKVGFVVGTIAAAFNALRATVNIASDIQKIEFQLKAVTNGAQEFARASELTYKVAQATGTSFSETATVLTRFTYALKESGNTIEEAAIVADSLNKALLITGATGSEATSVLVQISQALTKGQLNGDEFRSLAENSGVFLDFLAESLGVAKSELKDLAAEGKITTDVIVRASKIANAELSKIAGETALPIDRQLNQALNNVKAALLQSEAFKRVTAAIGEGIVAVIEGFSQFASNLSPILVPLIEGMGLLAKAIGAVLSSATALAALGLVGVFAKWGAALQAVQSSFLALAAQGAAVKGLQSAFLVLEVGIRRAAAAMVLFTRSNPILLALSAAILAVAFAWDAIKSKQEEAAAAQAEYARKAEAQANRIVGLTSTQSTAIAPLIAKRLELIDTVKREQAEVDRLATVQRQGADIIAASIQRNIDAHNREIMALHEKERVYIEMMRRVTAEQELQKQRRGTIDLLTSEIEKYKAVGVELTNVQRAQKTIDEQAKAAGGLSKLPGGIRRQMDEVLAAAAAADARMAQAKTKTVKSPVTKEDTTLIDNYRSALEGLRSTWLSLASESDRAKAEQLDLNTQLALYAETAKAAGLAIDENLVAAIRRLNDEKQKQAQDDLLKQWTDATTVLDEAGQAAKAMADQMALIAEKGKARGLSVEEIVAAQEAYKKLTKDMKDNAAAQDEIRKQHEERVQTMKQFADTIANGIGNVFEAVLDKTKSVSDAVREMIKQLLILLAQKAILSAFGLPGGFGSAAPAAAGASTSGIRIYNYSGQQATARIRNDGSMDINIGALTGAILKGGNSFDAALRRTYNIQRRGV